MTYITQYLNIDEPGYALLVCGSWGVGKTHIVSRESAFKNPIYVSLFGISTIEDIHNQITLEMLPESMKRVALAADAAEKGGETAAGISGAVLSLGSKMAGKAILEYCLKEADRSRPIIFDDLERSNLDLKDLLGTVNKYIEHESYSVIIIADVAHIEQTTDFEEFKEKIIGQTVTVEADIPNFCSSIFKLSTFNDIRPYKDRIEEILTSSGIESLRIVKQIIQNTQLFYDCLSSEIINTEESILALLTEFVIWTSLVRGDSRFTKESLMNLVKSRTLRISARLNTNSEGISEQEALIIKMLDDIDKKYRQYGFEPFNAVLEPELVSSMLFDGHFDINNIQTSVLTSRLYSKASDLPAWKVLFHWRSHSDEEIKEAIERTKSIYETVSENDPSVLLHIFGHAIWLSNNRLWDWDIETTIAKSIEYIENVRNNLPEHTYLLDRETSYDKCGYVESSSPLYEHYEKIKRKLIDVANEQKTAILQQYADNILKILESQPNELFIFFNAEQYNPYKLYLTHPMLHLVPSKPFLKIFDEVLSSVQQQNVCAALRRRIHLVAAYDSADLEKSWVESFVTDLMTLSELSNNRFKKLRYHDMAEDFIQKT